ncbi:hypothetical protein SASPL_104600 [Salvia splendens]|uniref:J domain-containing protein n=1 Tax=Salvia splendens TaxID=180675 RepID=A0A8X8YHT1_SALSN|nr:hypothetical protein SASPL_104600 [Salvia splendens]
MEHPFFPTTTTRAEALRWLTISEKLLSARDLMGSKSFATRARDSDPTLTPADQILAVVDTLLAGDRRIANNQEDWYAILRLTPQQGRELEVVASQYRSLAFVLNPQNNKFPFADQAFRLVVDAWSVLSNPTRRSLYDREISFYLHPQPDPHSNPLLPLNQNFIFNVGSSSTGLVPPQQSSALPFSQVQVHASTRVDPVAVGSTQNFMNFNSGSNEAVSKETPFAENAAASPPAQNNSSVDERNSRNLNVGEDERDEDEEEMEAEGNDDGSTLWTACPYCYYMYEYPNLYADCTLRCQNCKKAFQAVVIPSPPPVVDGQDGYFCCWGFIPMGFSMENWEKNKGAGAASSWSPFSPMFNTRKPPRKSPAPRIYFDEDERKGTGKDCFGRSARKAHVDKGKNVDDSVPPKGVETPNKTAVESSKRVPASNGRKQPARVAKNFEKLDLNVEFSNEAEEPAPRANQGNGPSRGEDDNIEGIGFFEGLDEFLSSLPILNVVGDDKVVKAA